jgi:hypothetical protein
MDPEKTKAVADWPIPCSVKEVQSFIRFVNFYHQFIKHFSQVACSLHNLTKKDVLFAWTEKQQEVFLKLKKHVCSAPILAMPLDKGKFRVSADALAFASGAELSQLQDGKW